LLATTVLKHFTDDSGLLWAFRLVLKPNIISKMLTIHKHSPIGFGYFHPFRLRLGFIMVDGGTSLPATIVSPSWICRDHRFRGFAGSVRLKDSYGLELFPPEMSANADVTIGSHLREGCTSSAVENAHAAPSPQLRQFPP
jgi:hypothetical protein